MSSYVPYLLSSHPLGGLFVHIFCLVLLYFFSYFKFRVSIIDFDTQHLLNMSFANIFFQSVACFFFFWLFQQVFHKRNLLILIQSDLKVKVKLLSRVQLFATLWTAAQQAPPSMGFFRQEYWSGLPFPFYRGSSRSRDRTRVSRIGGRRFIL